MPGENFDRDFAVVLQVLSEIDGGHAALPQLPLEAVAVGERGREARVRFGGVAAGCLGHSG